MVKIFTAEEKSTIIRSIASLEAATGAEILVVVTPASDAYQSSVMAYGFMLGSLVDLIIEIFSPHTTFALLLLIQLAVMSLAIFAPVCRRFFIRFVPARIKRHRAAHRAHEEYIKACQCLAKDAPLMVMYISLAERYTHIFVTPIVEEKLPLLHWNSSVARFVKDVPARGLARALVEEISTIGSLLAANFPRSASHPPHLNDLREIPSPPS